MSESVFTLTPRTPPLRILSTSDWHLGNARVPAHLICDRMRITLFPLLAETDLLNIGGDVWDTLLTLSSDANIIIAFLIDLLRVCDEHQVVVRVLLGTFSHDRGQSKLFELYHDKCHFSNDLRYIDCVSLEEISTLNVRVLYLPDDLPYESSEACLKAVSDMMKSRNWMYVDYVFGHGYFEHMLPLHIPRPPKCTFKVTQFSGFVRRYVCMGHIHLSDISGNVMYNNSFDRLAHGEEAPKGFMMIEDHGTHAKLRFVANDEATKFITLDMSVHSDKESIGVHYINSVKNAFGENPVGYVRVIHPSAEIRQALQRLTTSHFPQLLYSFRKSPGDTIKDTSVLHKSFSVSEYPTPNEHTLPQMVLDFLEKKQNHVLSYDRVSTILASL